MNKKVFFVCGSPRSGTSALSWALAEHEKIETSAESNFLYYLLRNENDNPYKAFDIAKKVEDGWFNKHKISKDQYLYFLGEGIKSMFFKVHKAEIFIEQSPENVLIIDKLLKVFPDTKIINIMRDGREVVNSMVNSGFPTIWSNDFKKACETWSFYVEKGLMFSKMFPENVLNIYHKDLVDNPESVVREILEFFNLDYDERIVDYLKNKRVNSSYENKTKEDFKKAKDTKLLKVPMWKKMWSKKQVKLFDKIAGKTLELLEKEYKKKNNKVSVIIVTYNNLDLTKRCLYSVEKYSNYENLEVIIVDNNSQDGTKEYLKEYAKNKKNVKVILNEENLGFSAGNNIGIKNATGDYIVLLNNDTFVTPNWIERLMAHFELDNKIGLVGPRTNNIGNEAKIETNVKTEEEIVSFAEKLYKENRLKQYDKVRVLAFFCVMIKKEVFDKIGLLDEAFGIGMFEDDDFCERAKKAGYKLVCADDVFIYHHLSATFDKEPSEWKKKLFEKNKKIYESKHGKWIPHKYRR